MVKTYMCYLLQSSVRSDMDTVTAAPTSLFIIQTQRIWHMLSPTRVFLALGLLVKLLDMLARSSGCHSGPQHHAASLLYSIRYHRGLKTPFPVVSQPLCCKNISFGWLICRCAFDSFLNLCLS
ncbi:hypothetical protein CVT26_002353 [Gymnopilus dilepis]|uniref:Uncharacterized protein n=1 Tax=Gymnopilus dilepis TaxID=231916 RepID=A0A409Y3K7_9AGAR|nr:hypothetical protein CVT26_002353 [Gymnopilus dilepis]